MFKTKSNILAYEVVFVAPFELPKKIEVYLDKPPSFDQMKKFIIHLRDKSRGYASDENTSAFFRDIYSQIADELMVIYNQLACEGKLQREYSTNRVVLSRHNIMVKGFGR